MYIKTVDWFRTKPSHCLMSKEALKYTPKYCKSTISVQKNRATTNLCSAVMPINNITNQFILPNTIDTIIPCASRQIMDKNELPSFDRLFLELWPECSFFGYMKKKQEFCVNGSFTKWLLAFVYTNNWSRTCK